MKNLANILAFCNQFVGSSKMLCACSQYTNLILNYSVFGMKTQLCISGSCCRKNNEYCRGDGDCCGECVHQVNRNLMFARAGLCQWKTARWQRCLVVLCGMWPRQSSTPFAYFVPQKCSDCPGIPPGGSCDSATLQTKACCPVSLFVCID